MVDSVNKAGDQHNTRGDHNGGNGPHFLHSPASAQWRKSSFSAYNGNCVEVADLGAGRVGVRDSKAGPGSPVLQFAEADWAAFLASVKSGR